MSSLTEKSCTKCGTVKSASEFNFDARVKSRLRAACKLCTKAFREERKTASRDRDCTGSRICSGCRVIKPVLEFYRDNSAKSGVTSACKACMAERAKKYRRENPDKVRARKLIWRRANPRKVASYAATWRNKYSDSIRQKKRDYLLADPVKTKALKAASYARCAARNRATKADYYRSKTDEARAAIAKAMLKNPGKYAAHRTNRKVRKLNATPAWFSEFDAFVVEEAYNLIVKRRDATGMDWQLDHIVPIAGRLVCGLHVGANLQLLPAALNNFKRNRYDPNTLSAVRTGLFVGV